MAQTIAPSPSPSPSPSPPTTPTDEGSPRFADRLLQRRGAWLALAAFLLVVVGAMGALRGATIPPRGEAIPPAAESARVAAELAARPASDVQPVLLVGSRGDGAALSARDRDALAEISAAVTDPALPRLGSPAPQVSADGAAAYTLVPVRAATENTDNIATISHLRVAVHERTPDGLTIQVTGGPAFGADIADAFSGADLRLLLVTVGIVLALLLITYRSPLLALVPLLVISVADQLAAVVTAVVGQASGLTFDAGIVSVLVFGAGANYALLLISRYREELRREPDHRRALATAWRAVVPAILASNLTVVLALLTLLLAAVPGTRGLGLAGATGLLIALAAAVLVLPTALSLLGRRVFWPFVPRPDRHAETAERSPWWRLGHAVVRRPLLAVLGGAAILGILATGLLDARIGLNQSERFRVASESQQGLAVLERSFPAGIAAPMTIVADAAASQRVADTARGLTGVVAVTPVGAPYDGRATLTVVGQALPGSEAADDLVTTLRAAVHDVPGAHALVGGAPAVSLDAHDAARRDLTVVAPLVLLLTAVVLMALLRAVRTPLVLLGVNVLSSVATIGLGAWASRAVFGTAALDVQVPLVALLFLVALGVDYTIFLVHRATLEARTHGIAEGMARAVGATGAVITSAGLVLAGVFAALGVLPLVVLGQLGLIVGLGVVIDAFLVRAIVVPGVVTLLGRRESRGVASAR